MKFPIGCFQTSNKLSSLKKKKKKIRLCRPDVLLCPINNTSY